MNRDIIEKFLNTGSEIRKIIEQKPGILKDVRAGAVATRLQFQALRFIEKNPKSTVGEVAEALVMSSGSIAQLIERLDEKKWIVKETDENDKRIFHISLTNQGKVEILKMRKLFLQKMSSMISLISENDLNEIVRIQENILKKLKERK